MERTELIRSLTERKPDQPRIACFDFVSEAVYAQAAEAALQAGELRDETGLRREAWDSRALQDALAARRLPHSLCRHGRLPGARWLR